MTSSLPISSNCHSLQLPPTEKDDRLNLNVRTGSASTLYNSLIFTFGGLTIGLDIFKITIDEILTIFTSNFINNSKSKNFYKYLSNELFYLNLIEKKWSRVKFSAHDLKPPPRLFHEILSFNNCIYLYGGLIINPIYQLNDQSNITSIPRDLLIPTNDFWEFNLETNKWKLLYSSSVDTDDEFIPRPSFCNKLTSINCLSFAGKPDHCGILIAGGKDDQSQPIYSNLVFDLVDKKFIPEYFYLNVLSKNNDDLTDINNFSNTDDDYNLNIDYYNSMMVSSNNQFTHYTHESIQDEKNNDAAHDNDSRNGDKSKEQGDLANKLSHEITEKNKVTESLLIYSPVKDPSKISNPLLSFRLSKSIKGGKVLPVHRKFNDIQSNTNQIIPYNLRYPIGGLFGQNLVLTGFLQNDYDISIFIFNKPTGKWSRLNVFCNHDYGSHRFWGGFAWHSHHKVVLIGNYVTSRTTSAIRYFTSLITLSLPITNILASSELAGGGHYHDETGKRIYFDDFNKSTTDDSTESLVSSDNQADKNPEKQSVEKAIDRPLTPPNHSRRSSHVSKNSRGSISSAKSPRAISFSEYVHYAAPTNNFTTINSIFPPAAITLGRNFFDRFGDLTADFEIIAVNGDRIPVSLMVLIERWGNYFIELLARGYVSAVEKFDQSQNDQDQRLFSRSSTDKSWNSLKSSIASSHESAESERTNKTNNINKSTGLTNSTQLNSSQGTTLSSPLKEVEEKLDKNFHLSIPAIQRKVPKDVPQFRLPFQDSPSNTSIDKSQIKAEDKDESLMLPPDKSSDNSSLQTSSNSGTLNSSSDQSPHHVPPSSLSSTVPLPPQPANFQSRKGSTSSFSSNSSLLNSHLQDIPAQLPLPNEPIPPVPTNPPSFKSSSRKNSNDLSSPRGSLIHTLTALRNIPISKSPRSSPLTSPRASVSQQGGSSVPDATNNLDSMSMSNSPIPSLRPAPSHSSNMTPESLRFKKLESLNDMETRSNSTDSNLEQSIGSIEKFKPGLYNASSDSNVNQSNSKDMREQNEDENNFDPFDNILLNFENLENGTFQMESSLIPRKLYIPFTTTSIKAFCEYLYTGQIGNKWLLSPTTLDNLALARHYKVPLLYDLICEVLYGIIGRREAWVINKANQLKVKYFKLLKETNTPHDPDVEFPLDEYQGFIDTVDDGYLDIALLKKSLRSNNINTDNYIKKKRETNLSTSKKSSRKSSRRSSRRSSMFEKTNEEKEVEANDAETELDHDDCKDDEAEDKEENEASDRKNDEKELTDSSMDKVSSNSEDDFDNLGIGYLDSTHDLPTIGPRSKSIFDRADIEQQQRSSFDANSADEKYVHDNTEDEDRDRDGLTLEHLVSPVSPIPSLHTIELIYESVSLVADLKLMLRANNAKQMSNLLTKFEIDIEEAMEEIKRKFDERERLFKERDHSTSTISLNQKTPKLPRTLSSENAVTTNSMRTNSLRPVPSALSLHTVDSHKSLGSITPSLAQGDTFGNIYGGGSTINLSEADNNNNNDNNNGSENYNTDNIKDIGNYNNDSNNNNNWSSNASTNTSNSNVSNIHKSNSQTSLNTPTLERARTNSSLRAGISGLTPFKPVKTEPKLKTESNKDIDKRITKLIKRDEKLKSKNEKEEKLRVQNQIKLEKKKLKENAKELKKTNSEISKHSMKSFDEQSVASNDPDRTKLQGIFHSIGTHLKSKDKDDEANKLTRTISPTGSVVSSNSKNSESNDLSKKKHFFSRKK